jgi:hypothetical protein
VNIAAILAATAGAVITLTLLGWSKTGRHLINEMCGIYQANRPGSRGAECCVGLPNSRSPGKAMSCSSSVSTLCSHDQSWIIEGELLRIVRVSQSKSNATQQYFILEPWGDHFEVGEL